MFDGFSFLIIGVISFYFIHFVNSVMHYIKSRFLSLPGFLASFLQQQQLLFLKVKFPLKSSCVSY